jgi:hypothetical protein
MTRMNRIEYDISTSTLEMTSRSSPLFMS